MARTHKKNCTEKYHNDLDNHDGTITHLARHPGVWSQVGLMIDHYKQS